MATKKRKFYVGVCYHVYNRAVNKSTIFHNDKDYNYFISKIEYFRCMIGVEVLAYVILPNHYHFLLKERINEKIKFRGSCVFAISQFISRLEISYAKHYNLVTNHSGSVFQGPFRDRQIYYEDDFNIILKYIIMNPVKHNIAKTSDGWKYVYFNPTGQP